MAKKTFVVTHPNLYMKVDGKMQRVEPGTDLDEKYCSSLKKQGKVLVKGQGKKVNIGKKEEAKPEDDKADAKDDNKAA